MLLYCLLRMGVDHRSLAESEYPVVPFHRSKNDTRTCRHSATDACLVCTHHPTHDVRGLRLPLWKACAKSIVFRASATHRFYVGGGAASDGLRQFAYGRLNGPLRPTVVSDRTDW